jgi:hypothetical protein
MSQEFENIKTEILDFRESSDKKHELAKQKIQQSTAEDRKVLVDSGIKKIFEEIRDSGLVTLKVADKNGIGVIKKFFGGKKKAQKYTPAQVIDSYYYISLRFDEDKDTFSEVRIAAIDGRLSIAHGYNRVDFTVIPDGGLADAIIEGLKNPLRVMDGF